jgi:superfamily II DNA/RNA helicase
MFDMGFEPQIMRIVNNIRPDRQTVLFSATFPRAVEALARTILQDPVEIQVRLPGGACLGGLSWLSCLPELPA